MFFYTFGCIYIIYRILILLIDTIARYSSKSSKKLLRGDIDDGYILFVVDDFSSGNNDKAKEIFDNSKNKRR